MPVHDRYARVTPYELAFPRPERLDELSAGLASDPGGVLDDPGRFLVSGEATALLEEIHGEEEPERLLDHGILLFHAVHFRRAGEPLLFLEASALRRLVEGSPPAWSGALATRAGYLQLPQHLVWTDSGEGERPESVDGVFWTAPEGRRELSLLLVAGVRPDRPGFSVVPVLPVPLDDAPGWAELRGREEGDDFTSTLPGADLDGLYQLRTAGEVLKLTARALAWVAARPAVPSPLVADGGGPPQPTRLPYRRIELD